MKNMCKDDQRISMMELELEGFDGNYTLEENIRQFFHVWVEGTKRIASCQHWWVDAARYLPDCHDLFGPDLHPRILADFAQKED